MSVKWDKQLAVVAAAGATVKHYQDSRVMGWLRTWLLKWPVATTIGKTIYLADSEWGTDSGADTLRHELVHVRDFKKWSVLFLISYALVLPAVFSLRAVWEWRGYRETLRALWEEHRDNSTARDYYCSWVADQFCGSGYGWMFPFHGFWMKKGQKLWDSFQ